MNLDNRFNPVRIFQNDVNTLANNNAANVYLGLSRKTLGQKINNNSDKFIKSALQGDTNNKEKYANKLVGYLSNLRERLMNPNEIIKTNEIIGRVKNT